MTNIYNARLSSGYFPSAFKCAKIIFIPKENKSLKYPLNYKPISLLEVPSKVFEKFILKRLNIFLNTNNINRRQHGFRSRQGTHTAITTTYETIANVLAEKKQVVLVLRDVDKAFDKVWHNGLKFKITNLNLPPLIGKILYTYLDDRKAKISIGTELSTYMKLESGVPQGSILSPTLYTLYTNDLSASQNESMDTLYADDTSQIIITPSKSKKMMKMLAQREIKRINSFESKWKIKTSEVKFKIIPIAQRYMEKITINYIDIGHTMGGTLLGLKIQANKLNGHIIEKKNKGNNILTKLKRFTNLTPDIKATLIKTLLLPVLEYPSIPICNITKNQFLILQTVLNKALKFINQNDTVRLNIIKDLHKRYNIVPINVLSHNKAKYIWETISELDEDIFNKLACSQ